MAELSHIGAAGEARMVDVVAKPETARRAVASGRITFSEGILDRVLRADVPKGAVLETARIAGIQGAKRTSDLIPMCHPLRITDVSIAFRPVDGRTLAIEAAVSAVDRTGVEMEALTAVSVACLTIYDMVKAVDRDLLISSIRLLRKEGGKGGVWVRAEP